MCFYLFFSYCRSYSWGGCMSGELCVWIGLYEFFFRIVFIILQFGVILGVYIQGYGNKQECFLCCREDVF